MNKWGSDNQWGTKNKWKTEDESDSSPSPVKSKSSGTLTFILIYILVLLLLLVIGALRYKADSKSTSNYRVLIHNMNKNHLERESLQSLQETIQKYDKEGVRWSLLIPETEVPLEYDDGDTHYEVERISNNEQIIRLTYELALLNHPAVKYRVKNNSVEPMFTFGPGNYFFALFWTILTVAVIGIFKHIVRAIIWILEKINPKKE